MKTFCTEIDRPDGRYDGPIVMAKTWRGAQRVAAKLGAIAVGEFGYEADMRGNVLLIGTAILGESFPASRMDSAPFAT